jgi:hypothetical protein
MWQSSGLATLLILHLIIPSHQPTPSRAPLASLSSLSGARRGGRAPGLVAALCDRRQGVAGRRVPELVQEQRDGRQCHSVAGLHVHVLVALTVVQPRGFRAHARQMKCGIVTKAPNAAPAFESFFMDFSRLHAFLSTIHIIYPLEMSCTMRAALPAVNKCLIECDKRRLGRALV